MVAPAVLAAGIGAGGSVLGGIAGGKGAKRAAKTAAKSQEKITKMNNALVQGMYNSNAQRLDPYIQSGTRANNVLMELLLGPASNGVGGGSAGGPSSAWNNIVGYRSDDIGGNFTPAAVPWIQANLGLLPENYSGPSWQEIMAMPAGRNDTERDNAIQAFGSVLAANAPQPGATGSTGQPTSALSAWDQFRNSTNYNWRFGQGQEALAQNFAGTALDSGAQRIAELEYGQQFASNELANWMNMLAGQQGVGLQAGGALAGVGMASTNAQMANNQNAADARSNAALIAGQANQNMWGSIGQGIGQVAGAFGSSYAGPGGVGQYAMPYASHHGVPGYRGGGSDISVTGLPTTYNYGY